MRHVAAEFKDQGKKKGLFLCFHNSARFQMAEGLLMAMHGDRYEVHSAGVAATRVDPRAVKVMAEIGIDISAQSSKGMDELRGILFRSCFHRLRQGQGGLPCLRRGPSGFSRGSGCQGDHAQELR